MSWPSSFCEFLIQHFSPACCGSGDTLVAEKETIKSASLAEAPPHPHPPLLTFVKSGVLVTLLAVVTKFLKKQPQEGRFILAHSLGVHAVKVGNAWPQEHKASSQEGKEMDAAAYPIFF